MKKRLSVLFVVLAVTAIFASTVFAAPVNGKSVSLLKVDYMQDGVVLWFETSGLTQADLNGATFEANSNFQSIYCTFVDDSTTVRCSATKDLAGKGGFKVTLAGFIFWGDLPKERSFGLICSAGNVPWYTFNAYEYGELFPEAPFEVPVWVWDEHEASGGFEIDAQYGWTYEIIGTFCAPDLEFLPD